MSLIHPEIAAPKAAVRALIDACGGAEAVCALLGLRSRSLIDRWANPNLPTIHAPLLAVWRMESFCGRAIVSQAGVRRVDEGGARPVRAVDRGDMAKVGKELSDVIAAKAAAWADGKFCARDRRDVAKEVREAMAELAEILDAVEGGE